MDLSTAVTPSTSGLGRVVDPSVAFSTRLAPVADHVGCTKLTAAGYFLNAFNSLTASKKRKGPLADPKP